MISPVSTSSISISPTSGISISPSVVVHALDAAGNLDPTFGGTVSMAIGANPAAGTLSGTTSVAAVSGVATLPDLSIDKAGTGYDLIASYGTLTDAVSNAFTISPGPAISLDVSGVPSPIVAGASSTLVVTARDAFGNLATGYDGTVGFDSSDAQAVVPPDYTFLPIDGGQHAFAGVSLGSVGTQSITATDPINAFTGPHLPIVVDPGTAATLAFTVHPSSATSGLRTRR